MTENRILLDSPLDMHLHLRDGKMLEVVAPLSAETFAGAIIMPNLVPPVDSLERLLAYRERILAACAGHDFDPLMMLFFRDYSETELEKARPHLFGIKLYPEGATTNSEGGVRAMADAVPTLRRMEEMGIPLMVHGESHGFVMDRETEFLDTYEWMATEFPKLRITMEHITTAGAVELLDRYENLHATVTLQHLVITLDDVAGGLLNPHLFCKPIAKRPEDREALLAAALSGHPKLMFGSDSAPHPRHKKECCGCAAGVFTAPLALARLAELFERHNALDKLGDFVGGRARAIHGFASTRKMIVLTKEPWTIPASYGGGEETVIPMEAGRTLPWKASPLPIPKP
ncbi:MAG: dihydroorotase [Verrucomicrobiales bacterium]